MRTYTFHVSLPRRTGVWRRLELHAGQTLADLHWAIQRAFALDGEHYYSFFMSGQAWDHDSEYCLPDGVEPRAVDAAPVAGREAIMAETAPVRSFRAELLEALGLPPDYELPPDFRPQASMFEMMHFAAQMLQRNRPHSELSHAEKMMMVYVNDRAKPTPADADEYPDERGDVHTTTLESLSLTAGQTFLYHFDYSSEDWQLTVRVQASNENAPDADYPLIVEAVGEAPPQYPDQDNNL
ncbi:MAG: hypothetical protein JW910_20685 [Anaerolineae bacterium]|nr:hypothetical protein [Anaerolineae bacterium]